VNDILVYLPKRLKKDSRPVEVPTRFYKKTKRGEELPGWKKTLNWVSDKTNAAMDATVGAGLRTLKPIADIIVFPVLSITPIRGQAMAADIIIDLALFADRSNKAIENTRDFYYDAIIEIDDIRNAWIDYQEEEYEKYQATKDIERLKGKVRLFDVYFSILEEHLDIHSENILNHYLPLSVNPF